MRFFKPTPYVEYLPPKLTEGKEWYVHYSVINPATGKMVRYRNKVNRPKTVKERRQIAKLMIASISEKLALGWNPILEKEAPKSYHTLIEAMDTFLKVKTKETEENSLRSYKSYIKILKNWLTENNYPQDLYVAQFNEPAALDFMDDVEDDDRLSARTYNNYRSFYVLLWNWFIEKKYASTNPFSNIKKKPKKLTKKIRSIRSLQGLTSPMLEKDGGFIPDFGSRYFTADFPYGLAILKEIADVAGVSVPNMQETHSWYENITENVSDFRLSDYGISTKEELYEFYLR